MLAGHLDEPLLLARDADGRLRCLSNVCTHRGNVLVTAPCRADQIRCSYHSRRFDLQGRMTFMPGFEQAKDFPGPRDHLPGVPLADSRAALHRSLGRTFDDFVSGTARACPARADSSATIQRATATRVARALGAVLGTNSRAAHSFVHPA